MPASSQAAATERRNERMVSIPALYLRLHLDSRQDNIHNNIALVSKIFQSLNFASSEFSRSKKLIFYSCLDFINNFYNNFFNNIE